MNKLVVTTIMVVLVALSPPPCMAASDEYLLGYVTALAEREFQLHNALIDVHEGNVKIAGKLNGIKREDIRATLLTVEGVKDVTFGEDEPRPASEASSKAVSQPSVFLPKKSLFDPLLADPRWPQFSASVQLYSDDPELDTVGAVSFGETFKFYEADGFFGGRWQIGLQAGVFSIFDLEAESHDLVNSDFYVSVPLMYRRGSFSGILRVAHQSSHLGDEFLLRNRADRINLSYEETDLILSQDIFSWLRLYGGGGYIINSIPGDIDPAFVHSGLEVKLPWRILNNSLLPVLGVDVKHYEENDWNTSVSVKAGFQVESAKVRGHQFRVMAEYYEGNSPNGQFYQRTIQYTGGGVSFLF